MKVLFLGNGSFHSLEAEKYLRRMTCEVVYGHNDNKKYNDWKKDYDLGISFLYAFKVPDGEASCKQWINFHWIPIKKSSVLCQVVGIMKSTFFSTS